MGYEESAPPLPPRHHAAAPRDAKLFLFSPASEPLPRPPSYPSQPSHGNPPPPNLSSQMPYDSAQLVPSGQFSPDPSLQPLSYSMQPATRRQLPPIVIPQTSKSIQGVHFSAFSRAYPSCLAHASPTLSKSEFIQLLDGLNAAFIASPVFQALDLAGNIASFAPSILMQVLGGVVSVGALVGSAATSRARTKAFVKHANAITFGPRGLCLKVLSTKDMLAAVGVQREDLDLPPLPEYDAEWAENCEGASDDPRMRWMQALDGNVAALDWEVPEVAEQKDWSKKMGTWQAKRRGEKKTKDMNKKRERMDKQMAETKEKAEKEIQKTEKRLEGIREEIRNVEAQAATKLAKEVAKNRVSDSRNIEAETKKVSQLQLQIAEEEADLAQKLAKIQQDGDKVLDQADKKERKVAQKIRWIVILPNWGGRMDSQDVDTGMEEDS